MLLHACIYLVFYLSFIPHRVALLHDCNI
uniref:Uncharacterized protein n=1 Tax=Rhizophora mucronata TaxID=61149 RepID=A0A2P2NTY5_RHIMU